MFIKRLLFPIFLFFLLINISEAQINTESLRKRIDSIGFVNSVGIMLNFNSGNTNFKEIIGNYSAVNKAPSALTSIYGYLQYTEGNESIIASEGLFYSAIEVRLSKYINPEFYGQANYDRTLALESRYLAGAGARLNLSRILFPEINVDVFEIFLRLSIMYEDETYFSTGRPNTQLFKANNYLTFRFKINELLDFYSITYHQFAPDDSKKTRVLSNNALLIQVSNNFKVNIDYNIRHDNEPPLGKEATDVELRTGLIFEF